MAFFYHHITYIASVFITCLAFAVVDFMSANFAGHFEIEKL